MSNSFPSQNTNKKKYRFHIRETPERIERENENGLECLVITSESRLTLEIKESLQTFVDLEWSKTQHDTFNVDVPTSKIDRTLGIPITLQNVFRELEVDNKDKDFYPGLNDDEEIASYRIKYLLPYSPFLNPIGNMIPGGARTEPQLRILICEKFNEIAG
ncbi:hypothetical protein CWI38_0244p0050 [Hamiltosporidium tvaerminnensis]|uniref:Uncharacterized protein n=1 Tax=Hamiltosporidium tvaerminnensis TaxID=1176355 RepID=A0A4Q9M0A2_9MICR|nr:hypothetical protein CWI38_0244p0050 [Hamiltosporidium tvaerminnensis]